MSDVDVAGMVEGYVNEHGGAIVRAGLAGQLPQDVLDAAQDFQGALGDQIEAGRQLERDRAELARKKDLLPVDGYQRLWGEAHADAKGKTKDAERAAEHAFKRLETALEDAALPRFDASREALARDEAALAVSNGDPAMAARDLALRGNDEALAALLSPWGLTLLRSRGAADPEQALADVRKIAVQRALERQETVAAKALKTHLGPLSAAKGTASSQVRTLVGNW